MSFLEPVELPQPKVSTELFVGAASPLWAYFSGAAMSGVAFWWMTRWTQQTNLEALFAHTWSPAKAADAADEITSAVVETAADIFPPMGGESAPISPIAALASEAAVEIVEPAAEPPAPEPEPVAVAPAEPATFAPTPTAVEPDATDAGPKPKVRKVPPPAEPAPDLG